MTEEELDPGVVPVPKRDLLVRLGLGLAALFGLLGGPAAMAVGRGWWQPLDRTAMTMNSPSGSPRNGGAIAFSQSSIDRPGLVRARLQALLDAQAAALLGGDEAGFLAPVDPGNSALRGDLSRRFVVLRSMNIAGWTETLGGEPEAVEGGWRAVVRIGYCFVVAGCEPVVIPVPTRWADAPGPPRLVELGSSDASDLGPRPWEVSDLRVAIGSRVVVAATPRYADRVPALLAAAEKAAAVTDRYARWGPPPGRYLVYLAGPEEWGRWYGVRQAQWVAGYAMPITVRHAEIVLNGQRVAGDEVVDTLRHEFAHVVTLVDVHRDYSAQWWLVEGVAEYVRMVGRPLSEYELLSASRRYVRAGNPTGVPALTEPAASASAEDASGRYGVAFLSVRRLAERYGEEKMLRFFDQVVRQGVAPQSAAAGEFGVDWGEITGDCAGYVRRNLG
ncbi:hypothetical protein HC028_03825 [Planosporangium flavigriseum]|uniref:Peptidase MA superfamily protein n=1 Tax=Planosporangium flavigriseum TaxID=373681 RepID=A0A8J3LG20_9ACTN|nr:hypothetical protein [Planosporangium flavigriseum]NJC63641.1 hypothetical protein [Planosporangium flavigriseum]GIG72342.1 hypothetical protein Pfl04_07460 [Planosporangium flavigriseum]